MHRSLTAALLALLLASAGAHADPCSCMDSSLPPSTPVLVGMMGDSITAGNHVASPARVLLQERLRALHNTRDVVVNLGVPSATAASTLTTWTNSVRGRGYDVLALMIGVNDMRAGTAASTTWTSINTIVTQALADGITVILTTVTPWKGDSAIWTQAKQDQQDSLNTSIRGRAGVVVIDLYPSWETSAGSNTLLAAYDSGDKLHPNQSGSDDYAMRVLAAMGVQ